MLQEGMSARKVARELRVSKGAICRLARRLKDYAAKLGLIWPDPGGEHSKVERTGRTARCLISPRDYSRIPYCLPERWIYRPYLPVANLVKPSTRAPSVSATLARFRAMVGRIS